MKKCLCAVAALALCATGWAANLKSGEKVLWLGDGITWHSLYHGKGDPFVSVSYVAMCEKAFKELGLDVKSIRSGAMGATTVQAMPRLERDVYKVKSDYLVVSFATLDAQRNVPLATFQANLTSLVEKAQALGKKVILLTSSMLGEDAANEQNKKLIPYNNFVRELAKTKKCTLVDVNKVFQQAAADYRARAGVTENLFTHWGNFHPDFYGNVVMARTVLKEGFGFTCDEMKKAEGVFRREMVRVPISHQGGAPLKVSTIYLSGGHYIDVLENAIADKMGRQNYIGARLGAALNERATEIFMKVCDAEKFVKGWPPIDVSLASPNGEVYVPGVALSKTLYTNLLEKATAAKMTPAELVRQKLGVPLNAELPQLFKDFCYLRTEKGSVPHPHVAQVDLPIWDISKDAARQAIVAEGTKNLGHFQAATARADDGTIYAVRADRSRCRRMAVRHGRVSMSASRRCMPRSLRTAPLFTTSSTRRARDASSSWRTSNASAARTTAFS